MIDRPTALDLALNAVDKAFGEAIEQLAKNATFRTDTKSIVSATHAQAKARALMIAYLKQELTTYG